jgi:hypothetical protein
LSSHVEDHARGVRKFRQALAVYPVIHEGSATLGKNKPRVAKNLQMMRYRRLPNWKVLHDLADADRFVIVGQQVENANTHRVGKGVEAAGVLLRARLGDLGGPYLGATIGSRAFSGRWHGGVDDKSVKLIEECQWMTRAIGSFAKESATRFDRRHSFTEREGPLGNNPEEIVAIGPQTVIHTTPDVPTPQSAAYSREANQVFVGSDAGKLNIYDGTPGIGIDERWLRISALCSGRQAANSRRCRKRRFIRGALDDHLGESPAAVSWFFDISSLTTVPPFITNLTRCSSVMSFRGSWSTAITSA